MEGGDEVFVGGRGEERRWWRVVAVGLFCSFCGGDGGGRGSGHGGGGGFLCKFGEVEALRVEDHA